jgi:hypothetical protein
VIGKVVSGPYEGAQIAAASRPTFVWIGGPASKPRCYKQPGAGRLLHRSLGSRRGVEQFEYAHLTHRICDGCGGYIEKSAEGCYFCGATPARA